jgi:hypothetical protein
VLAWAGTAVTQYCNSPTNKVELFELNSLISFERPRLFFVFPLPLSSLLSAFVQTLSQITTTPPPPAAFFYFNTTAIST